MILLGTLPLLAFALVFVYLASTRPVWGWGRSFLRTAVFFGAYAVLGAELLSLPHAVTLAGLVGLWSAPIVLLGALMLRWRKGGGILRLPRIDPPRSIPEWSLVLIVIVALSATAIVAYAAPPNTWDSLTYHMARVAHWAQAGSLGHYATGIERQNLMAPGAEIGMLHAYVLAQGDRLANFPEWLAMVASVIGAAALASRLGASRAGQMLAAAFVATLPMGIAQATSTMTDYVVAIWVVCVAFETFCLIQLGPNERVDVVPLAMAAGLAILAKPTAFAFLAPFALVVAVVILRQHGVKVLLTSTAIATALIFVVNAGYLGRNQATYANPLGSAGKLETHANAVFNAKVVVSNLIRNASLHAATPWSAVNDVVFRGVIWIHLKMGQGLTDPSTTVHSDFLILKPKPDELRAGNPLHALLAVITLLVLAVWALRGRAPALMPLLLLGLAATGFVLLSSMFKFSVFGGRYHLPFFVLVAPAVGWLLGRDRSGWLPGGVGILLLLASPTYLFRLQQRPLLRDRDGQSVLTSSRASLFFPQAQWLEERYSAVTNVLLDSTCSSVGIMLSGDAAEYPLWPLLGAPRSQVRLEWIVAGTPSARYADPSFRPCAVICDTSCPGDWTEVRGMPLSFEAGGLRLYMSR